jgi:SAM-dependent methyltransferase
MLRSRLRNRARRSAFLRAPLIAFEFLIKRGLATILWAAWQSHLHPFLFLRGKDYTSGRYYIEQFLTGHAAECGGRFLEFGDPYFRRFFDPAKIERYDIVDVSPGPQVTIVADLQCCPHIPADTYDVIICTQVLEHIANPFLAVAELCRILKPGGRLLLTAPAAYPYHAVPRDYWRFTRDSLQLLFGEGFRDVAITPYGNKLAVVAAYWFWMRDHLPRRALLAPDPDCPLLLAVYACKDSSPTNADRA